MDKDGTKNKRTILKKCKICKSEFSQRTSTQVVCSLDCSILLAQNKRIKSEKVVQNTQKRELKAQKEAIKPRSAYMKEAQTIVNQYVRIKDMPRYEKDGCISCGSHTGKLNASHYRSVGSAPELRFEAEYNIFIACEKCNSYLSGNLIPYRTNLLKLIGEEKLEWLEGKHPPKKYTISDLKQIKSEYAQKIKDLKRLSSHL